MNRFVTWKNSAIVVVAASVMLGLPTPSQAAVRKDPPASIRGAIYVPAEAYNAPQMWKNFSLAETRRDFEYAREVHLNALRIWASYEYWQMEPAKFQSEFDQLLVAAHDSGIRVLVSLFENDGVAPTPDNMWTTDPQKAFAIQSPGKDIATADPSYWEAPRRFVAWFMNRYRNDDRVLAVEVMNEPRAGKGAPGTVPFAKSMFTTAKSLQGTVPLTLGSARIEQAEEFIPLGLDVIEFHDNFPPTIQAFKDSAKNAVALGQKTGLPVWLTEWQRVRASGSGFSGRRIAADERMTDYASMASTVHSFPVGSFFWSLMVKRAYLKGQRANGTVNGLFWPDGAVTSLKDAQAIAEDPHLHLRERPIPASFENTLQLRDAGSVRQNQ
jgi:hypothetical protein